MTDPVTLAETTTFDPGLAKMVLMFGGASVVAVWGLWHTTREARRLAAERAAASAAATAAVGGRASSPPASASPGSASRDDGRHDTLVP